MLIEFLLFFITLALGLCYWHNRQHNFWRRHNIKYLPPAPIFGNLRELCTFKQSFSVQLATLYNAAGLTPADAFVGIYTLFRPALLIRDVDLVKRIFIKDFNNFSNRVVKADPHHDPLGHNNLFFVRNPEWRDLRTKLSPVFTSGKVKQMYPLMVEVARELETLLNNLPKDTPTDIKDICGRFTNELIGTTAFGIRAGSLRNENSQFYKHSRAIFEISLRRAVDFTCMLVVPSLLSLLRIKLFTKATTEFLRSSVEHVMAAREQSGNTRNDLIDTLLAMKREAQAQPDKANPARNMDFLVAQAALFHTAGYETSSSTMTFALYELALQPELQERLRSEIRAAFAEYEQEDGGLPYERLQELPYLGQVIDETLRKYPVVGFLERECTAGTDKQAGYSLQPFSDFMLPVGTPVYVSPLGIHRDERYWPEPDKFDPERFAPANRKQLNMNAYMPFGLGPHNCIGMRIGLLEAKLGLIHILRNHRVLATDSTTRQIQFDPRAIVLTSKENICLQVEPVESE